MKNSLKSLLLLSSLSLSLISCYKDNNSLPSDSDDTLLYNKSKISMDMEMPDTIKAEKINKISALIVPNFDSNKGQYPALVTEVTIQEQVPEGNNDKPSIPVFITDCSKESDTTKRKRTEMPGKTSEASETQISKLNVDSENLETKVKYKTETIFIGSPRGSKMVIKMYTAIFSKSDKILAKSQEFSKTYLVE